MALNISNNSQTRFGRQMDEVDKAIDKVLKKKKRPKPTKGGGSSAGLGSRRGHGKKK